MAYYICYSLAMGKKQPSSLSISMSLSFPQVVNLLLYPYSGVVAIFFFGVFLMVLVLALTL